MRRQVAGVVAELKAVLKKVKAIEAARPGAGTDALVPRHAPQGSPHPAAEDPAPPEYPLLDVEGWIIYLNSAGRGVSARARVRSATTDVVAQDRLSCDHLRIA